VFSIPVVGGSRFALLAFFLGFVPPLLFCFFFRFPSFLSFFFFFLPPCVLPC